MDRNLLQKYITGEATADEKADVMSWLDADVAHMKDYMALRKLFDMALWREKQAVQPSVSRSRRSLFCRIVGIAAFFVLVFSAGFTFQRFLAVPPTATMQSIYVPAGQRAELTLTDGTKVWLNAKTTFTFPNFFTGDTRNVLLDGEGYFEVKHNAGQPFIVNTNQYDIRVLGTEFNVLAYAGSPCFETSLLKGSVEVYAHATPEKTIRLKPDMYVYLENGELKRKRIDHPGYFLWREGLISFHDATVADMIAKLQLYFDVRIDVHNDKLLQSRYSGKFRTKDGVEHVLKVLQLRNKFTYQKDEELNIITIR